MERFNKLVRDKIPDILNAKKIPYEQRVASSEEYRQELTKKLTEEIKEFIDAPSVEELADIMEVIDALRKLPEFANVDSVKAQKLKEKGGFEKRIILKGGKS